MYRVLGFYPNRIEYYREALHHKSSPMVSGNKRLDNERLEFLGDAVLNVLVTDILYHHFKEANEGFLTKLRSRIVRRDKLNQIAKELGLDQLLINSLTDSVQHDSVYGNALEALVGAIYADKGYRRCKQFMEKKIFEQFLDLNDIVKKDKDFKSSLLEWSQKNKQNIQIPTERHRCIYGLWTHKKRSTTARSQKSPGKHKKVSTAVKNALPLIIHSNAYYGTRLDP